MTESYHPEPHSEPQEPIIDYDFSDAEQDKIDRYMNGGFPMNYHDAALKVYAERPREVKSISPEATQAVLMITENPVTHPHYSRRGGRAFPDMSDSEGDPNWNTSTGEIWTVDQQTAYDEMKAQEEVAERNRAIKYLMESRGMPQIQAEVVYKIRKEKREREKRERGIA